MLTDGVRFIACWWLLGLSAVVSLSYGSGGWFQDPLGAVLDGESMAAYVFWQVRLPRVLCAAAAGAGLGAAGVLTQGLFRNPLASPSVMGTTAGATAFGAVVFWLGWATQVWWLLPLAAVVGAGFSTAVLLAFSRWLGGMAIETFLLLGFALGMGLSAVGTLMVSLSTSEYEVTQALFTWLLGGFAARSWSHLAIQGPLLVVGLLIGWRLAYRLDVVSLGWSISRTLGVDSQLLQRQVVWGCALLVGGAVAVGGGIGFVGLLVPHLTRALVGVQHRRLLWASAVNGASLLVLADLLARWIIAPAELQVGVLTALLGTPFFVAILIKRQRRGVLSGSA